jgi:hypothetical protein
MVLSVLFLSDTYRCKYIVLSLSKNKLHHLYKTEKVDAQGTYTSLTKTGNCIWYARSYHKTRLRLMCLSEQTVMRSMPRQDPYVLGENPVHTRKQIN